MSGLKRLIRSAAVLALCGIFLILFGLALVTAIIQPTLGVLALVGLLLTLALMAWFDPTEE